MTDLPQPSVEEMLKRAKIKKLSINTEKGTFSMSGDLNSQENTTEEVKDTRQLLNE